MRIVILIHNPSLVRNQDTELDFMLFSPKLYDPGSLIGYYLVESGESVALGYVDEYRAGGSEDLTPVRKAIFGLQYLT